MIRRTSTARTQDRRGGALLFALIVVTSVTAICVSLLRLTNVAANRQRHAVDDKRAFYLAEAGLSQAYFGLGAGMTGQVGTIAAGPQGNPWPLAFPANPLPPIADTAPSVILPPAEVAVKVPPLPPV